MKHSKLTGTGAAVLAVATGIGLWASGPAESSPSTGPEPGADAGRVIEVRMLDDGGDYRFEPETVEARRGDVVRFVQAGRVPHNVEFVRNGVPAGVDLGEQWVGSFLNTRGETYEVEIDDRFRAGRYPYICTPHAAMGMTGEIVVEEAGARGASSETGAAAEHGGRTAEAGGSVQPGPPPRSAENGGATVSETSLPVVKGERGARELSYTLDGGVKVFALTVERIEWQTKEGTRVEAWAFNRQVPGPTIRVREGDRVRIVVRNRLPESTTAHWHGLEVPNAMDGVPGVTQDPIEPGDSFVYEFTAKPAGTRLYHSHTNSLHQEGHGLYGMFIVEERTEPPQLRADREAIMVLGDGPLGFVINGKEHPAIEPIEVETGERVRVRMANLGGVYHPMHLHGGHFEVVAKDGYPVAEPQKMNTISLAPGETYDVILEPEIPGTWLWHCHVLAHVTGPEDEHGLATVSGMMGTVEVSRADAVTE